MGSKTYFALGMFGVGSIFLLLTFLPYRSAPTTPDPTITDNENRVVVPTPEELPRLPVRPDIVTDAHQGPVPPELSPPVVGPDGQFNQDELSDVSAPDSWVEAPSIPVLQPPPVVWDIPISVRITWPALEQSVIDAAIRENTSPALLVGLNRPIPRGYRGNLLEQVRWTEVGQRKMAHIQLSAEGASDVNVRFLVSLPTGSSVIFLGTLNEMLGHAPPVWTESELVSRSADSHFIISPSGERGELGVVVDVPIDAKLADYFLKFEEIGYGFGEY